MQKDLLIVIKGQVDNFLKGLNNIKLKALAIFGAISATIGIALKEADKAEVSINKMRATFSALGVDVKKTTNRYLEYGAAIQKITTFGDEEMAEAMSRLARITRDVNVGLQNGVTIADLATATNTDLATAARLLGMAYQGNSGILRRYGIVLQENISGEKALLEVRKQVEGQAKAQTFTTSGQLKQIKNIFGDFLQIIGEKMFGNFLFILDKTRLKLMDLMAIFGKTNNVKNYAEAVKQEIDKLQENLIKLGKRKEELSKYKFSLISPEEVQVEIDKTKQMIEIWKERLQDYKNLVGKKQEFDLDIKNIELDTQKVHLKTMDEIKSEYLNDQIKKENEALKKQYILQFGAMQDRLELQVIEMQTRAQLLSNLFSDISSLMASNEESLFNIGKAAALAQIAITTPVTAFELFAKYARTFPPPAGEILGGIAAAATVALGAFRASQVASQQFNPAGLATGGVVMRPMITPIAEREPEAVIPLSKLKFGGVNIVINSNGLDDADKIVRTKIIPAIERYANIRGRSNLL